MNDLEDYEDGDEPAMADLWDELRDLQAREYEALMQQATEDGGCLALDGCWVQPDGICPHGYPANWQWWDSTDYKRRDSNDWSATVNDSAMG